MMVFFVVWMVYYDIEDYVYMVWIVCNEFKWVVIYNMFYYVEYYLFFVVLICCLYILVKRLDEYDLMVEIRYVF